MQPSGRVLQVNVSRGGVPKLPVERAWVGWLGVEGDAHREWSVHGGPHRAVCLFAIEAIERLQSEGHPVEPGSVGENLTTTGIEWSLLPVGTRARIGARLEIELASSTTPCATQKPNFVGGRFSRISIDRHPSDSRMYARVVREGEVRAGDEIRLLPPAADSNARAHSYMNRIDPVEKESSLRLWRAARAAGLDVRVLDEGDVCAGTSPTLAGPAFNHAQGLRIMPQLLGDVLAHLDHGGTSGLVPHEPPAEGTKPDHWVTVHACPPAQVADWATPHDIVVRAADEQDHAAWMEVFTAEMPPDERPAWRALLPHLLTTRGVYPTIAEAAGRPVGTGLLHVKRGTGLLRAAVVVADARGRGIQRALIRARAQLADELGLELLASMAGRGTISARNLERMGLAVVESHPVYRYLPRPATA